MISIIVPIYNGEQYIKRCVKSILKQSYTDFELILVNDGSKDNSLKICEVLSKKDSRIQVISQSNQGPVMARRAGVMSAKGEILAFLDVDDTFSNKKVLTKLVQTIKQTEADFIQFGSYHTYFYGMLRLKKAKRHMELDRINFEQNYIDLFKGEPECITSTVWGKVYQTSKLKDVLRNVNIRISMGDDLYINNLYFERYKPNKYVILDYAGILHGIGIGISVDKAKGIWLDYVKLKQLQSEIIRRNSLPDVFSYHTYVEYLYLLFYCAVQIYEVSRDFRELKDFVEDAFEVETVKKAKEYLKETKYDRWEKMDEFCYLSIDEYCATVVDYVKNYTVKDRVKKIIRRVLYR